MDLTREQIKIYIQQINDKVKIKDILEKYGIEPIQGNKYRCPFHGEDKNPSASASRGVFHCFACDETLDVCGFVKKIENCGIMRAIKIIDNGFNLGLFKELTPREKKLMEERKILLAKKKQKEDNLKKFEEKTLNIIAKKLQECYKIERLTMPSLSDYFNNRWEFNTLHFETLKEHRWLEWLYNKICGFEQPECEYDYIYNMDRINLLRDIYQNKIKI